MKNNSESNGSIILTFGGVSAAECSRYANDLINALLRDYSEIDVRRSREQSDAQDFGSTLIIILGTTAVNTLAQGIVAWLKRNTGARLTIKNASSEIVAEHLNSEHVPRIIEALSQAHNDRSSKRKLKR